MNVDMLISTPSGMLSLNTAPYRLSGESFETSAQQHRRSEVSNPHVEGTFVINSVRDNVTTQVGVWVVTDTRALLVPAVRTLCEAFDQPQFTAQLVIDGVSQIWNCYASDYTIGSKREFIHATRARVDVQLIRDPHEEDA